MELQNFVQHRVKKYYWEDDVNCATTTLHILSEQFGVELSSQVIDAALGMHGAGKYGAQCGLVEGTLMFLGIMGRSQNLSDARIVEACWLFAHQFEQRFSSLRCQDLRPEGFHPDNPPHLCESLTCDAVCFNIEFIQRLFCYA
ncbi:MAG: C-GCAxxG-C-C family protein [Candidatus Vecturithrix sp.]|jgi:C_GCAxxG_C_C family probable redox protein|nr:C-GCAxxG-C-C family protein [Candidatus Vecturithrix sp.]